MKPVTNSVADSVVSCRDGQNNASLAQSPKSVDKKGSLFNCPLCLFIVAKKANLREHLSTAHYLSILITKFCQQGITHPPISFIRANIFLGDLCCPLCEKMFMFNAELAKHLGTTHKKLKEITTIHSKVFVFKMKHPKNWETALWGKERL